MTSQVIDRRRSFSFSGFLTKLDCHVHDSGPGEAIGRLCVCVRTVTSEPNDLDLDFWPASST